MYLGYEKLTREMLEEYVQGIYVYDDGRVEVEWKSLSLICSNNVTSTTTELVAMTLHPPLLIL